MSTIKLEFTPLHKTFGAVCHGVDFSKDLTAAVVEQIRAGIGKYGVVVFRKACMSDAQFVKFAGWFGEVEGINNPKPPGARVQTQGIGDSSNIYADGSIVQRGDLRFFVGKATALFHVDNSFDPRRVRYTMIKAVELPPAETGGSTEFSDSRTAYEELDAETKQQIEDKIAAHSIFQSRLVAAPYLKTFQMADPKDYSMGRHYIVQDHKPSGRKNLYVADDIHHIEGFGDSESSALIKKLMDHVKQEKYLLNVFYENVGDVAIWDNLAVLHRTGNGTFAGKFRRDLRRCICYDNTPEEWGLNDKNMVRLDAMAIYTKIHNQVMGGDAQTRLMNWD